MEADLLSASILLLLVIDPFGNVPLVVAALRKVPPPRRIKVVLRECLFAYLVLLAFMIGGKSFLNLLALSETSLSIAGGIVLFMIALRMVFNSADQVFGVSGDEEPFLVPLAIPAIAGPSALATVMLLASRNPERVGSFVLALSVAMGLTTLVLAASNWLERMLGPRIVIALQRLTGLVLTALAVEMLLSGVRTFARELTG
ncbi:MAG: NAAT family transporter [Pseudomonadota bacterium]|nr:NAAT family transporter [Pseudomonadota bacterium]